jgi:hypothetical protein
MHMENPMAVIHTDGILPILALENHEAVYRGVLGTLVEMRRCCIASE